MLVGVEKCCDRFVRQRSAVVGHSIVTNGTFGEVLLRSSLDCSRAHSWSNPEKECPS